MSESEAEDKIEIEILILKLFPKEISIRLKSQEFDESVDFWFSNL